MPTMAEQEPHRHRQMAESFGADPARYDRARPRYPDAMVERIVAACPGPDVLDVGSGSFAMRYTTVAVTAARTGQPVSQRSR